MVPLNLVDTYFEYRYNDIGISGDNTATRERRPADRCRRVRALHGYRDLELRDSGGGFRAGPPARPIYEAPLTVLTLRQGGLRFLWVCGLAVYLRFQAASKPSRTADSTRPGLLASPTAKVLPQNFLHSASRVLTDLTPSERTM